MAPGFRKLPLTATELRLHTGTVCRKTRLILFISALSSECDTVRVLCLQEGWHLLVAPNLEAAIELQKHETVDAILYDQDVPGNEWQVGVEALLARKPLTCLILLSRTNDDAKRLAVLALGGYDVIRKPLALTTLKVLVSGCWALDLPSVEVRRKEISLRI